MFRTGCACLGFLLVLSLGSVANLLGEDVQIDRDELASIGDQSIRFINYLGPHEFTNTLDEIRNIGRSLGGQIDAELSGEALLGDKYRVVHVVNPDIPDGLDADVFILESTAGVDHVNNLRTIIAGYLEVTYGFTPRDAYLIAEFVTYYNAVFRGDMDMVQERYKAPVVEILDPDEIGLDTHYSNWAGKTQMLIPLRSTGLTPEVKVDTGAITHEEVIDEMRQEEDMRLDSRKDMVELREEELDEEQIELDERREDVQEAEEKISEEAEELEDKEETRALTSEEEERQDRLERQKEAVEEEKAAIKEEQEEIDKRTEEVMRMRDEVAEDENERLGKGEAKETFVSSPVENPLWFIMVDDEGDGIPFGRIVKYNLDDGKRLAVSEVTAVRGRTLVALPDTLLVIAGKEGRTSKVRPMLLDMDTLDTIKEGSHDIYPGSLMTVRGSSIYLVTTENGEWRLGRFDANLNRIALSQVAVEAWTSISFEGSSLFVQSSVGEILELSASTLEEISRLE